MQYIRQILTALRRAGLDPMHAAALLVIVLIGFVVYTFWWKPRKEAAAAAPDAPPATAPDAPPAAAVAKKVPKDRFTAVYQRFRDELPAVVRRSLGNFSPFVLMGMDAGASARLVNAYTDWERQARFLFGSHVDDPNLKIYLGSRVLVLDMPESVLAETSSSARVALLKLWRPLFRRRTPTVVVAVSPTKLAGLRPNQIGDLADSIRGKVNLLSWVRKRPIEIRVALTDLEEIPGFSELAELAEKNNVPLTVDVADGVADYQLEGQLNERFAALESFIQLGLTGLSERRFASQFTELVRFLRDAPSNLSPQLATFLAALMVRQPLGEQPTLRQLYLTAQDGNAGPASPFATAASLERRRGPLFWHKFTAIAATAVASLALIGGYLHERHLYQPAKAAMQEYSRLDAVADQRINEAQLRGKIARFANRASFPGFFNRAQEEMKAELRKRVLELHIKPRLHDALDAEDGVRTAIYLIALAYAGSDNALGQLTTNPDVVRRWSQATDLPEDLVRDFVDTAEQPDLRVVRKHIEPPRLLRRRSALFREKYSGTWRTFFQDASRVMRRGRLNPVDLQDLRDRAGPLITDITRVELRPDAAELLDLISNTDPELAKLGQVWGQDMLEIQRPDIFSSERRRAEIAQFLQRVITTQATPAADNASTPQDLDNLCAWLARQLGTGRDAGVGQDMGVLSLFVAGAQANSDLVQFTVDDMSFDESRWVALTRDNTIREVLRGFERQLREREGLFFTAKDRFPPLELNPETQGKFLFAGKARVPGHFTMEAIERRIIPPLECLAELWPATQKIAPDEAAEIELVITRELENYASKYDRYLTDYYQSFRVEANDSVDALRTILGRILRGNSPLTNHLLKVANNSRLPPRGAFTAQFLLPLEQRLESFEVLRQIATSTKTEGTPLGDYIAFVAQIQESLEIDPRSEVVMNAPAAAEGGAGEAALPPLSDLLSPSGRMALQMLSCGPDSPLGRIEAWLEEVQVPKELRGPFLTLARQVYLVGRQNIEAVLAQVWQQQVVSSLQGLSLLFPFQRRSDTDVTAEQLAEVLHPITGRFAIVERTYLDPIKQVPEGCRFRYAREEPLPPPGATQVVPKLSALSRRLWDEKGQPRRLHLGVRPVAFSSRLLIEQNPGDGERERPEYLEDVLTLTFISSGSTTLVNFNQRPFETQLEIDWTKSHLAQVGVRLTNPETREEVLPDRLSEASNWALLRLFARAEARGTRYTWQVPYYANASGARRQRVKPDVSFDVSEDPFSLFQLSEVLQTQAALQRRRSRGNLR